MSSIGSENIRTSVLSGDEESYKYDLLQNTMAGGTWITRRMTAINLQIQAFLERMHSQTSPGKEEIKEGRECLRLLECTLTYLKAESVEQSGESEIEHWESLQTELTFVVSKMLNRNVPIIPEIPEIIPITELKEILVEVISKGMDYVRKCGSRSTMKLSEEEDDLGRLLYNAFVTLSEHTTLISKRQIDREESSAADYIQMCEKYAEELTVSIRNILLESGRWESVIHTINDNMIDGGRCKWIIELKPVCSISNDSCENEIFNPKHFTEDGVRSNPSCVIKGQGHDDENIDVDDLLKVGAGWICSEKASSNEYSNARVQEMSDDLMFDV